MRSRRLASVVLFALAMGPAAAAAQEGADALGTPAPPPGAARIPSPGATEVPPPTGPTPIYPAPTGTSVPPPPGAEPPPVYGEGRYPGNAQTAPTEGIRIPSRIATRLRVLDADFAAIASRSGSLVNGILSIVTGGISITIGILVNDELISPYLYVFGGAGVARGIIDLLLSPNPHDAYIQYSHMPMRNAEEVQARLEYGEQQLESTASRARLARILDASLNIGVGLAVVPVYLGPNDFEIDPFGAFILIGAGISIVSGVISLLSRSEAERRWAGYEELRDRLAEQEEAALRRGPRLTSFGASPLPGGGGFALGGTF